MVRYASLFSQLIAVFNRNQFYQLVLKHNSERYAKGYNSWDHFIATLFCQLAPAKSLREICGGLACCLWCPSLSKYPFHSLVLDSISEQGQPEIENYLL